MSLDTQEWEQQWDEVERKIIESNNIKAEVGDVVIICDDLPFKIVKLGIEGKDEFPYGLLCMKTNSIEVWSRDLNYQIGDEIFTNMKITAIIKKKMFQELKNL